MLNIYTLHNFKTRESAIYWHYFSKIFIVEIPEWQETSRMQIGVDTSSKNSLVCQVNAMQYPCPIFYLKYGSFYVWVRGRLWKSYHAHDR